MNTLYRTLFVGTLVQESFLSAGGTDDPNTTVDSPFCRDGKGQPTLRGSGLAGALIAVLRRLKGRVPEEISGSHDGRQPSVWRFFNSHPKNLANPAYRQHVAINEKTGAAVSGALFNVETLPPETRWPFLLEVDTSRSYEAADLAREALLHWVAGRCLIGRDVARGLGWMRLEDLWEYKLTTEHIDAWPNAKASGNYPKYIARIFNALEPDEIKAAKAPLPGWIELTGTISAGEHNDGYGIDSLSIGGHASEELAASWNDDFMAPDELTQKAAEEIFDPDFAVVTWEKDKRRVPYIPGSSLRGPMRHALSRLLMESGTNSSVVKNLFGTDRQSAKLLIRDALWVKDEHYPLQLAWMQHHAEDEFTAGAYGSSKFDRIAVMQGKFQWKMVLENATDEEKAALSQVFELARNGQLGIGGGQWRGHGWLSWDSSDWNKLEN